MQRCTVWRKTNVELSPKNLPPTVKHSDGSLIIWSYMSARDVGTLQFIEILK